MGEAPLTVARLHALETGVSITYEKITAEEKAQQCAGQFDIVTSMEMLEHVPDPSSVVKACADLVKIGGDVYFSTINRSPKAYAFAILGAEYLLKLLPKGTHDYGKFIRPSELAQWLRQAGLELQNISGMTYNPITKHYKLDANDVSVNYLLHAKKVAE
jgi:2-polyprenyl-6-hydroxyphenyl methylase/3-demethylubiquinone-9 3-methyltransferase